MESLQQRTIPISVPAPRVNSCLWNLLPPRVQQNQPSRGWRAPWWEFGFGKLRAQLSTLLRGAIQNQGRKEAVGPKWKCLDVIPWDCQDVFLNMDKCPERVCSVHQKRSNQEYLFVDKCTFLYGYPVLLPAQLLQKWLKVKEKMFLCYSNWST